MQQLRFILVLIFAVSFSSCSFLMDSYEYELQKNLKIDDCIDVNCNLAILAASQLPSEDAFNLLSDMCQEAYTMETPYMGEKYSLISRLYMCMSHYKNPKKRDAFLAEKALYYYILASWEKKPFLKNELEKSIDDWKLFSEYTKNKAILGELDSLLIKVTFPETTNPINCAVIESRRERINKFIEKYKSKEN